jgi:hypothetical protein
MTVSYTKLRDGAWGLKSSEPLSPGQTVLVRKSNGIEKKEVVGRIVYQGEGIFLATIQGSIFWNKKIKT